MSGADPQLSALYNWGGITETMRLGSGSPGINMVPCDSSPLGDQRGWARPDPNSAGLPNRCDAGAAEELGATDRIFADGFGLPPLNQ